MKAPRERPTPRDKPTPTRNKPNRPREPKPVVWERADPADLAKFDPASKVCTMNCGPSSLDPRSYAERKFLCDDCLPAWHGAPRMML
jgi:hypothetical protein